MKSLFKVSLLAATVALAVGCGKEEASREEVAKAEQVQPETSAAISFKSDDEKAAYAIGVSFANYLETSLEKPSELGVNLDKALVLKGIEDSFAGKAGLTEEEIQATLASLDQRVAAKVEEMAKEKSAATVKAGEEFRAEFEKQEGVKKTESGLLYQVLTPAEGEKPAASDTVEVHYVGTLTDGTKFDSSYDRNQTASFPLDRVIPGWTEGVQLMPVGSKFKFVIPPELAYGEQDTPTIPANSTLVFEVELVSVNKEQTAEQ